MSERKTVSKVSDFPPSFWNAFRTEFRHSASDVAEGVLSCVDETSCRSPLLGQDDARLMDHLQGRRGHGPVRHRVEKQRRRTYLHRDTRCAAAPGYVDILTIHEKIFIEAA